jgi:putative flavoprotein involved in K+ transport
VQDHRIVILGGGLAGLSTAGALKKAGAAAVVLDRYDTNGRSWLRRYDRLHLHTVRAFSGLAHFPVPRSYPKYLSRDMYAEYLQRYAETLDIDVVHDCNVSGVEVNGQAHGDAQRFTLRTSRGDYSAETLVVATGMFGEPIVPVIPGFDEFKASAIHSSEYKTARDYAGKRVLVVGIGNTGAEIAADLAEQGAQFVAISIRTAPPVVPRDFLGVPVQLFGIWLDGIPPKLADRIGQIISRIASGNLTRYGLPSPQWQPFSARRVPVIDVGFIASLKDGHVSIRPTIARFTSSGVVFSDGRTEEFDAVIFATGYRTGLQQLLNVPGLLDERGFPKHGNGEETSVPGLYFMGFIESHRGLMFEIESASRRLARTITGERRVRRESPAGV